MINTIWQINSEISQFFNDYVRIYKSKDRNISSKPLDESEDKGFGIPNYPHIATYTMMKTFVKNMTKDTMITYIKISKLMIGIMVLMPKMKWDIVMMI